MSDHCRYSKSITSVICQQIRICNNLKLIPCNFAEVVIDLESQIAILKAETEEGAIHE